MAGIFVTHQCVSCLLSKIYSGLKSKTHPQACLLLGISSLDCEEIQKSHSGYRVALSNYSRAEFLAWAGCTVGLAVISGLSEFSEVTPVSRSSVCSGDAAEGLDD